MSILDCTSWCHKGVLPTDMLLEALKTGERINVEVETKHGETGVLPLRIRSLERYTDSVETGEEWNGWTGWAYLDIEYTHLPQRIHFHIVNETVPDDTRKYGDFEIRASMTLDEL